MSADISKQDVDPRSIKPEIMFTSVISGLSNSSPFYTPPPLLDCELGVSRFFGYVAFGIPIVNRSKFPKKSDILRCSQKKLQPKNISEISTVVQATQGASEKHSLVE